jgi:hypothetical protein
MKQETVASIIKWSEETFGNNITLEGQLNKFKEEKAEWLATNRADIYELADMAIVASSIARFSVVEAMFCFGRVEEELLVSGFATWQLEEAINKKMQKNLLRTWEKKDGQYQHIEENKE